MHKFSLNLKIPKYKFLKSSPKVRLHEPSFGIPEIKKFSEVLSSTNVTMGKINKQF